MKLATKIGLAAAAALALTAMLGAASASASALTETVLCKEVKQAPYCKSSERYPKGTSFSASPGFPAETVTIEGAVEVSCSESTITGTTNAEAGEPLPVSISAWTLGGCKTSKGTSCTVTALERAPYSGSLKRTSGSDGTMSVASGGKGNPGWTVKCGFTLSCSWSIEPGFTYRGLSSHAEVIAKKLPLNRIQGFCPETASFTGTYIVNSPSVAPLGIPKEAPAEATTALCKSADNYYCEPADRYASGTGLLHDELTNLVFHNPAKYGFGSFLCEKGTLQASTTAEYGHPLPVSVELTSLAGCKTQNFNQGCLISTSIPGKSGIEDIGAPYFFGNGSWSGIGMTLGLKCGFSMGCTLSPVGSTATLMGGESGEVEGLTDLKWTTTESESICPDTTTLELGEGPPLSLSGPLMVTDALR